MILPALAGAALLAGLVHTVLVAAHVSEPAATTVHGLTARRLWATVAAALALAGVAVGGLAVGRPASRFGTESGRFGAIVALVAGLIAAVNGGLNLAIAKGGPGSGNGVVGGAAAFVLGVIALALGGLALARGRRTDLGPGTSVPRPLRRPRAQQTYGTGRGFVHGVVADAGPAVVARAACRKLATRARAHMMLARDVRMIKGGGGKVTSAPEAVAGADRADGTVSSFRCRI